MIMKRCSSYRSLMSIVMKNAFHFLFLVGLSSSLLLVPGISTAYKVDIAWDYTSDWEEYSDGGSVFGYQYWGVNSWKDSAGTIYSEALVHAEIKNVIDTRNAQGPVHAAVVVFNSLELDFYITPEYGTKGPITAQVSVFWGGDSNDSEPLDGAMLRFPSVSPGESFYWDSYSYGSTGATIVLPTLDWYDFSLWLGNVLSIDNQYGLFVDLNSIDFTLFVAEKPVPEPTTLLLLASGLIGLAGYGRKKFFKK